MKKYFQNLNLVQKLVLLSAGVAFISLFFNWFVLLDIKANGFQQGTYIFLLVFIYPVVQVLRGKPLRKYYTYINAFLGAVLGLSYLAMRTINEPDIYYIAWGIGPILFILSCVGLGVAAWKSKQDKKN